MIEVLFFARVRDEVGMEGLKLEMPVGVNSLLQFTQHLIVTHPSFAGIIDQPSILVAINQEFARPGSVIEDGDEIAYFPPVTGG